MWPGPPACAGELEALSLMDTVGHGLEVRLDDNYVLYLF